MNQETAWSALLERMKELAELRGISGLLEWDQQVMMPPAGAAARGRQLALVSSLVHRRLSDPALGELLDVVQDSPDPVRRASARSLSRSRARATRLPDALVRARAAARARGHQAWMAAREEERFDRFAPALAELLALVREEVAALRADEADPYDVLLDAYDPGSTVATLEPMFERLAAGTREVLARVGGGPPRPAPGLPLEVQRALAAEVVSAMGFDLARAGRLDAAEHPFTVGVHPRDVRLTQHLYADNLLAGLTGTIHEAGHGLYEQGLPLELHGTEAGLPASFGLHESQSRFWENFIGRSLPFFKWLISRLDRLHPGHGLDALGLFRAANHARPSLIRVHADELTYNLHIIVRYRLERALVSGQLEVGDLEGAWDEACARELGVRPDRPSRGVLQDVHWSAGLFAYFPSYTLGNLYAASLGARAAADIADLPDQIERGDFSEVLAWMRDRVHRHAHLLDAPDILRAAVGERDAVADLLAHVEARLTQAA